MTRRRCGAEARRARSARPARSGTSSRSRRSRGWTRRAHRARRGRQRDRSTSTAAPSSRASTTVPDERLGETLYRFGVITREQLETIVARDARRPASASARSAIELGIVTAEKLYAMMARQVEEVFFAAVHVSEGVVLLLRSLRREEHPPPAQPQRGRPAHGGRAAHGRDALLPREGPERRRTSPCRVPGKKPPDDLVDDVRSRCDGSEEHRRYRSRDRAARVRGHAGGRSSSCRAAACSSSRRARAGPRRSSRRSIPRSSPIHERCDAAGKGAELRDGPQSLRHGRRHLRSALHGRRARCTDGTLKPEPHRAATSPRSPARIPDAWLVEPDERLRRLRALPGGVAPPA